MRLALTRRPSESRMRPRAGMDGTHAGRAMQRFHRCSLQHRYDYFAKKYTAAESHEKFAADLRTLTQTLEGHGFRPKSTDLLLTVPAGQLDEFWVAPWTPGEVKP